MSTHKNRVQMSVTGTPGTGTITLNAASSGYQSFASAYGSNATVDILITDGTAWEVARDCTYTNSGTTITRGTLEASSTGSAISLTSSAIVSVIATADRGRTWDAAALNTQVAGTDADTTMAINTLYTVDMSAWATADRTYTLPATAAVGDTIGIVITAGDASHELIIMAGSGDTLNGIAGGTEWSRLFITNEVVVMRCVVANTTWAVVQDGRIPIVARAISAGVGSTTQAITTATWTTLNANLYTNEEIDNSSSLGADGGSKLRFTARRAGTFLIGGACFQNCASDTKIVTGGVGKNGASSPEGRFMRLITSGASGAYVASGAAQTSLAVGDYVNWYTYQDAGSNQNATDNVGSTYAFVQEVLLP